MCEARAPVIATQASPQGDVQVLKQIAAQIGVGLMRPGDASQRWPISGASCAYSESGSKDSDRPGACERRGPEVFGPRSR